MDQPARRSSTKAKRGALRPSGGLRWHLRALWHRRTHDPFRRGIGRFLAGWDHGCNELVVIGPSAGWFIPGPFLHRVSRLVLIELDTSAPFFFHWRHGRALRLAGIAIDWVHEDFVDCLPRFLAASGSQAVLFCNVLGQLGLEREDYEARLAELPALLAGRRWASFHDRFSARVSPKIPADERAFSSVDPMDGPMLQRLGYGGEWCDHGTGAILPPGRIRHYLPWRIEPGRLQWIEAGEVR
jgi:hypothetical protein